MKIAILGGPYSGKTTAHRRGLGFDPEESDEWRNLKSADIDSRDAYSPLLAKAFKSDEKVVLGHFSPGNFKAALASGRVVRIVVVDPDELERRHLAYAKEEPQQALERGGAALHQLSVLVHWLNTDGKWADPRIYNNIQQAVKPPVKGHVGHRL